MVNVRDSVIVLSDRDILPKYRSNNSVYNLRLNNFRITREEKQNALLIVYDGKYGTSILKSRKNTRY